MIPMTKQNTPVNIFDITYPCYVSPIPLNSKRLISIPESGPMDMNLGNCTHYVLEYYQVKDKLYVFDCLRHFSWLDKEYKVPYWKRLQDVRKVVYSDIANHRKVLDLETDLIKTPNELQNYIKELLTEGIKSIRIMNVDANYVFGECKFNEYMELEIIE